MREDIWVAGIEFSCVWDATNGCSLDDAALAYGPFKGVACHRRWHNKTRTYIDVDFVPHRCINYYVFYKSYYRHSNCFDRTIFGVEHEIQSVNCEWAGSTRINPVPIDCEYSILWWITMAGWSVEMRRIQQRLVPHTWILIGSNQTAIPMSNHLPEASPAHFYYKCHVQRSHAIFSQHRHFFPTILWWFFIQSKNKLIM